jgi:two-component system sensor histidine kinase YesM
MERKTMLKLLLQPLVENALYHGIKNKRGRGTITVRGWRENGLLCFSVADNGIGMTEEQLISVKGQLAGMPTLRIAETENRIYGLYNVTKRLELYYNRIDLLDIQSVYREGTKVTLLVPEPADEAGQSPAPANSAATVLGG